MERMKAFGLQKKLFNTDSERMEIQEKFKVHTSEDLVIVNFKALHPLSSAILFMYGSVLS